VKSQHFSDASNSVTHVYSVSNLGAGGTQDIVLSNIANATLYALFSISGLFAGAVTNLLGPRLTLFCGTLGYAFYISSLWIFTSKGVREMVIVGGAVLGVCAALLWSAREFLAQWPSARIVSQPTLRSKSTEGCLMMSLPEEKDKGRAFSIFWAIVRHIDPNRMT